MLTECWQSIPRGLTSFDQWQQWPKNKSKRLSSSFFSKNGKMHFQQNSNQSNVKKISINQSWSSTWTGPSIGIGASTLSWGIIERLKSMTANPWFFMAPINVTWSLKLCWKLIKLKLVWFKKKKKFVPLSTCKELYQKTFISCLFANQCHFHTFSLPQFWLLWQSIPTFCSVNTLLESRFEATKHILYLVTLFENHPKYLIFNFPTKIFAHKKLQKLTRKCRREFAWILGWI